MLLFMTFDHSQTFVQPADKEEYINDKTLHCGIKGQRWLPNMVRNMSAMPVVALSRQMLPLLSSFESFDEKYEHNVKLCFQIYILLSVCIHRKLSGSLSVLQSG